MDTRLLSLTDIKDCLRRWEVEGFQGVLQTILSQENAEKLNQVPRPVIAGFLMNDKSYYFVFLDRVIQAINKSYRPWVESFHITYGYDCIVAHHPKLKSQVVNINKENTWDDARQQIIIYVLNYLKGVS